MKNIQEVMQRYPYFLFPKEKWGRKNKKTGNLPVLNNMW